MPLKRTGFVRLKFDFGAYLLFFKRLKKFPYRRILITHLRPHALPTSIFKQKAKVSVHMSCPPFSLSSFQPTLEPCRAYWTCHFQSWWTDCQHVLACLLASHKMDLCCVGAKEWNELFLCETYNLQRARPWSSSGMWNIKPVDQMQPPEAMYPAPDIREKKENKITIFCQASMMHHWAQVWHHGWLFVAQQNWHTLLHHHNHWGFLWVGQVQKE